MTDNSAERAIVLKMIRVAALVLLGIGLWRPVHGQVFPSGFVDEIVANGLTLPTAFTTLPDGRILIAEKDGTVRVFVNGGLLPTPFIDLSASINNFVDRGLIGIAADLNFATNHYVYLMYVYENNPADYTGPKTSRLSRVTASGNVASPASEVVILGNLVGSSCENFPLGSDCLPADSPSHSAGAIKVANDGTLFLVNGDGASYDVVDDLALRSQNLDSLGGKILHITTTGQGVPNNPFWNGDANANRSKVWAYGLRNPFRFAIHPQSGAIYFGDVGWNTWEEVNALSGLAPGANFGWPCYEGFLVQSGYAAKPTCQALYSLGASAVQMPLVTYNHFGLGAAVVGGNFYTGTSFPSQYHGAFFFGDYALGFMRYLQVDDTGAVTGPLTGFGAGLNAPVYFITDGDDLLYVAIVPGEIHRIRYVGTTPGLKYLSDTTWTSAVNSFGPVERDTSNGDTAAGDGRVMNLGGQLFAKGLGVHANSDVRFPINEVCSALTAVVGVDNEVAMGGSTIFQVWTDGVKRFDSGVMSFGSTPQNVSVDLTGALELALITTDAGNGNTGDHGDWADAKVVCAGDTTPPTATSTSPPQGAVAVAASANATVTFSEAMDPATLTTTTMTLVPQGSSTPVPAVVTYDSASRTATLDPTALMTAGTVYTATVKGGSSGAKDLAGNPLTSDRVWTFTTAAAGTSSYLSDRTFTSMINGFGPVERDRSNGGSGAGDGGTLTLNGATYAKGLGAHASSDVRFALNGTCSALTTVVGVDDEVGAAGSVVFQVWTDGALRYDSGVMTGVSARKSVYVTMSGVTELALIITDGGDGISSDHGDWADAQVTCGGDTTPPTVTAVSPLAGSTGVALLANVTATFSEAMNAPTLTTTTMTLVPQGSSTPVTATVTYDGPSKTATLTPTAPLAAGKLHTATVKGGIAGAKDLAGNPLTADFVWTFTTVTDTTPPTITQMNPVDGSTGLPTDVNTTATFSEAMNAATLTTATVTLVPQGSSTPVPAAVTYDATSRTVTLDPTAALVAGTLYTATVKGGAGGVTDLAGNPLASNRVWTFTTAAAGTSAYLSDRAWTSMVNGWGPVERDHSNGDNGANDGGPLMLNGVTYAKGLGAHAASDVRFALNGTCSGFTAVVGVDDEVGAGGSVVFQVWTDGVQRYDSGLMTGATASKSVSVSVSGVTELALILTNGGDNVDSDHGDWADAQVSCGADTTAPTVTSVNPLAGSTGVAVLTTATATFSEAMNPATLTTATMTLVPQGSSTPVTATVTYDGVSRTATLAPTAPLASATVYTARVKGGGAGAKDLAGNPLAADFVWTFTTAVDTTPTVTVVTPTDGAGGVPVSTNITATFSEAMNP